MNWLLNDTEATCEYNGHVFIASRDRCIVMRDGLTVAEKTGLLSAVHAIVWAQKWIKQQGET